MLEQLFQEMSSGFALHQIVCDEADTPVDYIFLQINDAFERMTGLRGADILGKTARTVLPDLEPIWIETYGRVALTGEPAHFENYVRPLDRYFKVTAFSPERGKFAVLFEDITERRRTELAEKDQRQLADALRDTAALLNSSLNVETVIERILDNVGRVVPHDAANVMLFEGGETRVVGSHGYNPALPIIFLRFALSEFTNIRTIRDTGEPLLIRDTTNAPTWLTIPETGWIRSYVGAPIRARRDVIGVLNLDSRTPNFFDETSAIRLLAFADQAAVALENARLLNESQRRASQLQVLNRAAIRIQPLREPMEIYRIACDELQALGTFAQVYERVPEGFKHVHTSMRETRVPEFISSFGETANELVIADSFLGDALDALNEGECVLKQPVPAESPPPAARSGVSIVEWTTRYMSRGEALIAPLTRQNELSGILTILGSNVSESDTDAVALFARQVSAALENARLWKETRRRLHELDAINRISTVLRRATTQAEIATRMLDETLTALHAQDGQIAFYNTNKRDLIVHATRGWFAETPRRSPANDGIAGWVLQTNQPYYTPDFYSDVVTSELAREKIPPHYGGAIVPVRNMHEPIGVLAISVPLPREIDSNEIALLTTIAEIAGNAFARASSFAQTEQRIQQLAALRAIDTAINASTDLHVTLDILLTHALSQLNMDAGAVLNFEPASQMLLFSAARGFRTAALQHTQLSLGNGYAGAAARERRVIVVPDLTSAINGLGDAPLLPYEDFKSYVAVPLVAKGAIQGVLELFSRTLFQPNGEWLDLGSAIAAQAALTIDNAKLVNNLERSNQDLKLAYDSTIEGWSRALDLRDHETEGHTQRVTELTLRLARTLGVNEQELIHLKRGALLHDIGKMGIPDSILLKPGKLEEREWKIMRRHPQLAYEFLAPIPYLNRSLDIPYCHHERWDGAGYPRGLKGEEIPFAARIFAVVDTWDALRSNRPYRSGWMEIQVRAYLQDQAGKAFDPRVVQAFLQMI